MMECIRGTIRQYFPKGGTQNLDILGYISIFLETVRFLICRGISIKISGNNGLRF